MNKIFSCMLVVMLICGLALGGCSNRSNALPPTLPKESPSQNKETKDTVDIGEVDIDLTVLSSTMVYAEVYAILSNPQPYDGKTIKASGPYYSVYENQTKTKYHFIIIEDATACCEQGLEFVWTDHNEGDYPENGANIEVVGKLQSYKEAGNTYYYIQATTLEVTV